LNTIDHRTQATQRDMSFPWSESGSRGANLALDEWVSSLRSDFGDLADIEYRARGLVDRMALAIQATLLLQHAPAYVADAFCASRLAVAGGHRNYGTLPRGVNVLHVRSTR